jgi:glycosyltransferase involved in cell wall biosynthesis
VTGTTVEARSPNTLPITVVLPAFNRARLLERALRSVYAQEPRKPAQVIVVDDASTDDTPEVAKAFGAQLIRHGRNLGGNAAARDTGLRAARYQWVALLDDDDEWLPHHLETVWELTPGSVLVASSCVERVPDSNEHGFHGPLSEGPTVLDSPVPILHPENLIPASAAMVHRDTALAVGGFRGVLGDPVQPSAANGNGNSSHSGALSIFGCEDLDMWCRLLSRGRGTLSPRVGVLYHTHPGQLSGDWEAMHVAHLNVARSFAGEDWWSRGLVERRAGVTAWDQFRGRRRNGADGAVRRFARDLLEHPLRTLGVVEVLRHRAAVRRRTSRLAPSGEPSVAVLAGVDPAAVPERDRYEVDLSATNSLRAFLQLARRPSGSAIVSTRPQAALVRLAGARPVRVSDQPAAEAEPDPEPDPVRAAAGT